MQLGIHIGFVMFPFLGLPLSLTDVLQVRMIYNSLESGKRFFILDAVFYKLQCNMSFKTLCYLPNLYVLVKFLLSYIKSFFKKCVCRGTQLY